MGTIEKGILGGFSGKVGTVIGGTWKGIDYMRSKSNKRTFVPSQKQLEQQMKFALMMRFLRPMAALLKVGFSDFAIEQTGMNGAFSYNFANAIAGAFPAYSIDYSKALISRGNLPNALAPALTMGAGSIATFSWTDNSFVGPAAKKDSAILVAYCPEMRQAIYTIGEVSRQDLTGDLNLASFTGQLVETYIGFVSQSSRDIAISIFTGEVTVS